MGNIDTNSFNSALMSALQALKSARTEYVLMGIYLAGGQQLIKAGK
jgi:hypothetical protein